jgi:hypothetical protein
LDDGEQLYINVKKKKQMMDGNRLRVSFYSKNVNINVSTNNLHLARSTPEYWKDKSFKCLVARKPKALKLYQMVIKTYNLFKFLILSNG